MFDHPLIAVDGGSRWRRALQVGIALARASSEPRLTLVAVEPSSTYFCVGFDGEVQYSSPSLDDARAARRRLAQAQASVPADIDLEIILTAGTRPWARDIVEACNATECDVVVVAPEAAPFGFRAIANAPYRSLERRCSVPVIRVGSQPERSWHRALSRGSSARRIWPSSLQTTGGLR